MSKNINNSRTLVREIIKAIDLGTLNRCFIFQRLFNGIISTDKTIKLYKDYLHEILNEPKKEQVMNDIIQWINERLSNKNG